MMTRFLLVLLIAVTAVFAQGPGMGRGGPGMGGMGGPGMGPFNAASTGTSSALATYLGLTDTQIQSLKTVAEQTRATVQPLMQQIGEKSKALAELRRAGSTDAAAIGNLVVQIDALEKQVQEARAAAKTQALAVLTADQKTKLAALEAAAKLMPAIRQAENMGLIQPPAGVGPGPGPGPMPRPGRP
jgi:Spy/CpxP family protein refolding chaperone